MTEGQIHDKKKFFEKERVKTEEQILEIVQEQSKILKKERRLIRRKVGKMEKEIDTLKKKADSQYTLLEGKKKELTERLRGIDVEKEGLQRESLRLLESLQSKTVRVED
jgi:predicted  nucleic acid-binding Zn-ribbon protein